MKRRKFLQLAGVAGLGMQRFSTICPCGQKRTVVATLPESWECTFTKAGPTIIHTQPVPGRSRTGELRRRAKQARLQHNYHLAGNRDHARSSYTGDRAHLEETTAQVVAMLRREFRLRVYITLCPNVVPYQQVAEKFTFPVDRAFCVDNSTESRRSSGSPPDDRAPGKSCVLWRRWMAWF